LDRSVFRETGDRSRSIAARTAENCRTESTGPRNRIVDATCNRPLAHKKRIGAAPETVECILIFISDRLARPVCARHHKDGWGAGGEDKGLKRRVGQHDAKLAIVGSNSS